MAPRRSYFDTSAALKLIIDEAESDALVHALTDAGIGRRLTASWLLHTEMYCAVGRHPDDLSLDDVQAVLNTIDLIDLTRGDMIAAGTHRPLRSNDAIHLAVAVRIGADEMVTYDQELAQACRQVGMTVVAPE